MLDYIEIDGYKSIKHLALHLSPINILVGGNGSGKTNFVSFFELVNAIYEQRLQNFTMRNNADKLLFHGVKHTKEIKGTLRFSANTTYSFNLRPSGDGSMFLAEETSSLGREYNIRESVIRDSLDSKKGGLRDYLESCKVHHFHDTSNGSPLRSDANIKDALSLRTDGGNLPTILFFIREKYPKTLKRIELVVQSVVPSFERFMLNPSPSDNSQIRLAWTEVNSPEKYFDINDLSDGSIRFITLATLLLQPILPKIIILDEPELGLHPVAIYKLAGMVKSAVDRGCQVIIATQSVGLIDNFTIDDIITVNQKDGQSVFNRPQARELKIGPEDYSLGELWRKGVIG